MVRLLRAQPFESEDLDRLAETMKATPILKRDKFHRYYKSNTLPLPCIACSDGIVFNSHYYQMLMPDEILAVGAHEFNHIAKNHVLKRLPRTFLPTLVLALLVGYLSSINSATTNSIQLFLNLDKSLFIEFTVVLSLLFFLVISLYINASWLRKQETECDLSAIEFVSGQAMISSLARLSPKKISGWEAKLTKLMVHTHPTIDQRINDIQEAMKSKIESKDYSEVYHRQDFSVV
jgi:Zn-dependent protease with chaperone function